MDKMQYKYYLFEMWVSKCEPPQSIQTPRSRYLYIEDDLLIAEGLTTDYRQGWYRFLDTVFAENKIEALNKGCRFLGKFENQMFEYYKESPESHALVLSEVATGNGRIIWEPDQDFYDMLDYHIISVPEDDDLVEYFRYKGIINEII